MAAPEKTPRPWMSTHGRSSYGGVLDKPEDLGKPAVAPDNDRFLRLPVALRPYPLFAHLSLEPPFERCPLQQRFLGLA